MSRFDAEGVLGGAQAGWNLQRGGWVFGAVADVSALSWSDSIGPVVPGDPGDLGDSQHFDSDWLVTVRGRAGPTFGRNLVYATVGVAILGAEFRTVDGAGNGRRDFAAVGLAVGGGDEYAVTDSLSVSLEALYLLFDESRSLTGLPDAEPGDEIEIEDGFVVRLGVNWYPG